LAVALIGLVDLDDSIFGICFDLVLLILLFQLLLVLLLLLLKLLEVAFFRMKDDPFVLDEPLSRLLLLFIYFFVHEFFSVLDVLKGDSVLLELGELLVDSFHLVIVHHA